MRKRSRVVLAAGLLAIGVASVSANGLWPTLPIIGQGSFCASTQSGTGNLGGITGQGQGTLGSICAQTVPAGNTGLTGQETVPVDIYGLNPTASQSGAPVQTQRVPIGLIAPGSIFQGSYGSPKNLFRNGDLSVNPFQMGTSQASDISNSISTGADGFRFLGGASSAINWSSQTGATDIVAGQFTKSLRFQRKSANTDTAAVCQISVLTSQDSVALQGQSFVYSFWAKAGANLSPAQGNVSVTVAWGTGSDQSSSNFKSASWTGQTNAVSAAGSSNTSFPTSVASSVATVSALPTGATATWVQYWVSGTIGATATQVGTSICFTPVGTAGSNDWIETSNHQLEIVGSGVLTPTAFEHHTVQEDVALAQRFLYTYPEAASGVAQFNANATATTTCEAVLNFPTQMRAAPTLSQIGVAIAGGTTYKANSATAGLTNISAMATKAANTVNAASLTFTSSGMTAGQACTVEGLAGGAIPAWSSEL